MLNYLPDLGRLRVFYAVFSSGSITAAADQIHVTKSAVSQTIKLLQEEIGEQLFVRVGRSLAPTEAARSLFETIDPFMQSLAQRYSKRKPAAGPTGFLRIAAPPLFGSTYLLPAIAEFRKQFPGVRFQVQQTAATTPLRLLEDDEFDFCVADSFEVMFGPRSYFHVQDLITDPELVICSRQYWVKHYGKVPTYEQLLASEHISYHQHGAELCSWLKTLFGHGPKRLSPVLVVDQADAVLFAVQKHLGLGLVPSSMLGKHLKQGSVMTIGGSKGVFQNKMMIVWLKGKPESTAQTLFREHLVAVVNARRP